MTTQQEKLQNTNKVKSGRTIKGIIILLFNQKEIYSWGYLLGIVSFILFIWFNYICYKVQAAFPVCRPVTRKDVKIQ